jgi:hypothetical protein
MKYILFFLSLVLFSTIPAQGQDQKIHIVVAMTADCPLDNNTKSILKHKLLQMIVRQESTADECGAIVIVPEVNLLNTEKVTGGMRNIMSVELSVTLTVRNIITNTIFNTLQLFTRGEGYNTEQAAKIAINRLNTTDMVCTNFVETTKQRIVTYYQNNINSILTKANTLATRQNFDEALALLGSYPESLSGYARVATAINTIFKKSQTQNCSQILLAAQTAYSQQNYVEAAELVMMIDAQSSCTTEAQVLLANIKHHLDKLHQEQLEQDKEERRTNERIVQAQIKAVREIATAYFKRQDAYIFFW